MFDVTPDRLGTPAPTVSYLRRPLPAPPVATPGPRRPPSATRPRPPRPPAARLLAAVLLPGRLAWRQLRIDRLRLVLAVAGVAFACVLIFMQLGFRAALYESATALISGMRGELFLMHPLTNASFRPEPFPRVRGYQALAVPGVAQAVPVYLAPATWRNPVNGSRRALQVVGFDVEARAMRFEGLDAALIDALKRPDTVAFDRLARPEFGPVAALFEAATAAGVPLRVEVGGRALEVVGLVSIGAGFGADGSIVTNELNFHRIIAWRRAALTDLVALRLEPGADVTVVKARLREILPGDVTLLTYAELVAWERGYWETSTPIGFIFGFGSAMGMLIGLVIVYQILFSDISRHLHDYATLKALGYSNGYFARVVLGAATILGGLGFVPGILVSLGLYAAVAGATLLPVEMTAARAATVFLLTLAMCIAAGLLAVRKLRDANPADLF